jgi:acyl-CoA reductase-like NAD-dependent aldehyde dehydrogenase
LVSAPRLVSDSPQRFDAIGWRETSIKARREIFFKVVQAIKERRSEIVAWIIKETTSTLPMAEFDVQLALEK